MDYDWDISRASNHIVGSSRIKKRYNSIQSITSVEFVLGTNLQCCLLDYQSDYCYSDNVLIELSVEKCCSAYDQGTQGKKNIHCIKYSKLFQVLSVI